MKCYITGEEIIEEECNQIQQECYKKKNDKDIPKKIKRVVGWNAICKSCDNHTLNSKKK